MHDAAAGVLLYITGVTLFLILILPLFYRFNLILPLTRLMDGLKAVNYGNLDIQVPVKSGDEIGFLTQNFNEMVASIRMTREALKTSNRNLEQKIESRTKDLQAKNNDLEAAVEKLHQTQEQLLLQKKMASIGNLIAGLAHEINNPVGVIRSAADVSRRCLERLQKANGNADQILKILSDNNRVTGEAGQRIASLMENLRNFSRLDEASFQETNVHLGLESTLQLLNSSLPKNATIKKSFGEIPPIRCQPAKLNQAFMHILQNAISAIDQNGQISVSTGLENNQVFVEIEDNGKGIPDERMENLFEFHFTAGNQRVRLGSGLSSTYQILQEHQGEISINSTLGKGTTVRMTILISQAAAK